MNDIFYKSNNLDLKQDFNIATKMSEKSFSYEELIALLNSEKDVEKQFAVLELNEIKSSKDAMALVSNLVGQDGKIREVVAFKINELTQDEKFLPFFIGENFFEIFLNGILDINGNICRMVVELTWIDEFRSYLAGKLPECIKQTISVIDNLSKDEKQYKISKRNFQLYWSLEALYNVVEEIEPNEIYKILIKTSDFEDYTIREKSAKILTKLTDKRFDELKTKLKEDSNYYVRRYL